MRAAWVTSVCLLTAAAVAGGCTMLETKSPEKVNEYAQAQAQVAAGDTAAAAALLDRYVRTNPASEYVTDAWLLLGDCRMKLKDYVGAQLAYQSAQKDARTPAVSAKARAGLGTAMMQQKRWAEAARAYESALSVSERDIEAPTVMFYLGQAHIRSGNWTMGRDRLRKLADRYPNSPEAPVARDIIEEPSDTFSVQMGAFSTREAADALCQTLEQKGVYGAYVVNRPWADAPFAVRVGNYVTYDAAVTEAQELKQIESACSPVP